MSKWGRKRKKPKGFDYLEPTLDALEDELRLRTNDSHEGKSKSESLWPVIQINWQRSRYVYEMFYKYKKISREVYQYCLDQKLADAALIAKWKKPGYEKLCSTFVINPKNFPFGTVSICRVPKQFMKDKGEVKSQFSGCLGCATGKSGLKNIFSNKYGQSLAKIQILREKRDAMNVKQRPDAEAEAEAETELNKGVTPLSSSNKSQGLEVPGKEKGKGAWYDDKEELEYSDGSSTDDDEEVDTNASNKRKVGEDSGEVTATEAEATINLMKKQKQ